MAKSAYKGYNSILKGIVTRTDDPEAANNNNRKRIQVCIPSYHGKLDMSPTKTGEGTSLGIYPWAQICSSMFNGLTSNTDDNVAAAPVRTNWLLSFLGSLFGINNNANTNQTETPTEAQRLEVLYPSIGDYVWLQFEGGDIRTPVYVGAVSPDATTLNVPISPPIDPAQPGDPPTANTFSGTAVKFLSGDNTYTSIYFGSSVTSFGRLKWSGNSAKRLFTNIRNSSPTTFDSILTARGTSSFLNDLADSRSWNNYRIQKDSSMHLALKDVLGESSSITTVARTAQDGLALETANNYIESARRYSLTDQACILYFCNLMFNNYSDIATYAAQRCNGSLNSMHDITLNYFSSWSAATKEARRTAYNKILEYIANGEIQSSNRPPDVTPPQGQPPVNPANPPVVVPPPSTVSRPMNFKQMDSRWGNTSFSGGTMSSSGCVPTAMADIIHNWFNSNITPRTMADYCTSWGCVSGSGSSSTVQTENFMRNCYNRGRSTLGWNFSRFSGKLYSFNRAFEALKNGNGNVLVIAGMQRVEGQSIQWTNGGHIVCIYKVVGDTVYINDPGINSNSGPKSVFRETNTKAVVSRAVRTCYIFYKN